MCGVSSAIVTGEEREGGHAWCYINEYVMQLFGSLILPSKPCSYREKNYVCWGWGGPWHASVTEYAGRKLSRVYG